MTTHNDAPMYFTGQRCLKCNNRIYTDNFCVWCKKECPEHGKRVTKRD